MFSISLRFSSVVHRFTVRMSSTNLYESAVCKLNLLQSNKSLIDQIRKNIRTGEEKCKNLEDMQNYLKRTGVPMTKLDQLSVIHVAGTKGKGSTSAMCESILRHHGYRTGFYSSPHLVAVRERIRLDGKVISEEQFADHFHRVYNKLDSTKAFDGDMPGYFAFLTVLAFNTFLIEKVDVAIVEVGIGGIVDYTNVLRKVPIVGITALGLDHTAILGDTLPQIAAAKAGIMKPGCVAYTVPQPPQAMRVLEAVATEIQCPLSIAPKFESYNFPNGYKMLQCNMEAYKTNASLAIQLAHAWMRVVNGYTEKNKNRSEYESKVLKRGDVISQNGDHVLKKENGILCQIGNDILKKESEILSQNCNSNLKIENGISQNNNGMKMEEILIQKESTLEVPYETWLGLKECRWAGRFHEVDASYARFYLDGAHTKESVEICAEWFKLNATNENKILIFGATGDRNADVLMRPLTNITFKRVYFVVPTAYKAVSVNKDDYSTVEQKDKVARCETHQQMWQAMNKCESVVSECVADALVSIKKSGVHLPAVLVTGSLHLVGATLTILDPNLTTYS